VRVAVFATSAGLAGVAGAFYTGMRVSISTADFMFFTSLPLLLFAVVGGVTSVTGVLIGGLAYGLMPVLLDRVPALAGVIYVLLLLAVLGLGGNPNGVAQVLFGWGARLRETLRPARLSDVRPRPAVERDDARGHERIEEGAVGVRFGGVVAVSDATFDVEEGRVVGLMGPNGAGKTTLFNVITGLQEPTQGRVRFRGADITEMAPRRRARLGIGRTFQRLEVFGSLTVGDNVLVAAEMRGVASPATVRDELLDRVGLRAFQHVPADSVPTGIARLTELARALACDPQLLLLDEPSSGLSDDETEDFKKLIRSLADDDGRSVLLVEHDVELVMSLCSTIHVLDFGHIIATGPPEVIAADKKVQDAYLGADSGASADLEDVPA